LEETQNNCRLSADAQQLQDAQKQLMTSRLAENKGQTQLRQQFGEPAQLQAQKRITCGEDRLERGRRNCRQPAAAEQRVPPTTRWLREQAPEGAEQQAGEISQRGVNWKLN